MSALTRWDRLLLARGIGRLVSKEPHWLLRPSNSDRLALVLLDLGREAEPAIPALLGLLRSGSTQDRTDAAVTLGLLSRRPSVVVPALTALLWDATTSRSAVEAIGAFGPRGAPAIPEILLGINEGRSEDGSAVLPLAKMGVPGVAAIRSLLGHQQPEVRRNAAAALAQSVPDARTAKEDAMKLSQMYAGDPDADVRRAALRSAAFLGPEAAELSSVMAAALYDGDHRVREIAREWLSRAGAKRDREDEDGD